MSYSQIFKMVQSAPYRPYKLVVPETMLQGLALNSISADSNLLKGILIETGEADWITIQYIVPLNRFQKIANLFRRLLALPVLGRKEVISMESVRPAGLLTDDRKQEEEQD